MTAIATKSLSEVIQERHSVRKYDPAFKISKEEIKDILAEAVKAPSSSNLQPWRFIVIQGQEEKKRLRGIAYNQEQVETASCVIAVLGDKEMYKNVEQVYRSAFEAGYLPEETMNLLIESTNSTYPKAPESVRKEIASFDAGLVSMQIMLIAKDRGYDTVPMAGFNKEQFSKAYQLPERFFPILLLPVGKAAAPGHKTTRLPIDEMIIEYI